MVELQTHLTQEEIEYIVEEARYGDLESLLTIFQLVDLKLLPTMKDTLTESTPLHMAAANGHIEVVKYLLSLDVTDKEKWVNQQNLSGNTSLHWASLNGHIEVVKYLCEGFGGDPFIKNRVGHDAIFDAGDKPDVEEYFLTKFSFEVEDEKEDQKEEQDEPTFMPGNEIEQVTKEAKEAQKELEASTKGLKI